MTRFVLMLIISWLIWSLARKALLKKIAARMPKRPAPQQYGANPLQRGELVQDPVCGTHIVKEKALSRRFSGQLIYFCSAECRGKFEKVR